MKWKLREKLNIILKKIFKFIKTLYCFFFGVWPTNTDRGHKINLCAQEPRLKHQQKRKRNINKKINKKRIQKNRYN